MRRTGTWAAGLLALLAAGARADRVRLLDDPREAMLARAAMIRGAKAEILAGSFIVGDDRVTYGVLALLRDAARRGVEVKLLADASWNHVPGDVQAHLRASGVAIRDYHVLRIDRPLWITQRMHDKLLVVDGRVLLVGGRNVESPYFADGASVKRRDYLDCDVEVESAQASAAREYFLELWDSNHVERTRHSRFPEDRDRAGARIDEESAWLLERIDEWSRDPLAQPGPWHEVDAVRFVHDPVGRKDREPGVAQALLRVVREAEEDVAIETPYLIPGRTLKAALASAQRRGATSRILTNSLATTDNLWPQAAYAGDKQSIMRRGVALWEYSGPESLHSKVMVIDGVTSVVGSFNLDPRSHHLNTEVAVIVEGEALASELRAVMDSHLERAWRIGPDGRPVGEASRHPGVPRIKVLRMQMRRLWVPFLRRQI